MSITVIPTAFNEMRFHENDFPRKAFQQNAFHEMQEKYDGVKERNPRLLIISVGRYCMAATT